MEDRLVKKILNDSVFLHDVTDRLGIHPAIYVRMVQQTGYLPGVITELCDSSTDDPDLVCVLSISAERSQPKNLGIEYSFAKLSL